MLSGKEKDKEVQKKNIPDSDTLEQSFSQLSVSGKAHLKGYLQNLVSLQNTITEPSPADNANSSLVEESGDS